MLTAVAAIAAAAATLSVTVAAAAPPSLSASPATVRAGHTVKIKGSADGCTVGNTVYVLSRAFARTHEFAGVPAVLAKVRPGGSFQATTRIPRARRPGRYGVTARCGGGNLGVAAHLTVTA
jgi:ABC-type phosphate transport system substrate-binding protein